MFWQAWIPASAALEALETQRNWTEFDDATDQIKAGVINSDIHITSLSWVQLCKDTLSAVMVGGEIWAVLMTVCIMRWPTVHNVYYILLD